MWSFLVVAQLLCAAVLILSGLAKAREPEATRDAFAALRLPRALADSPAPTLLPWAELVLGALIVVGAGWVLVLTLLATLVLFVAYLVIIGRALGFAVPVRCGCFGRIGDHDVSRRTLVRNSVLVGTATAGLAGALGGVSTADVLLATPGAIGWILAAALAGAVGVLVLGRAGGPTADAAATVTYANHLVLREAATGTPYSLGRLPDTLLLFVTPGCGGCERVAKDLAAWRAALPGVTIRPVYHDAVNPAEWAHDGVRDLHLTDNDGNVGLALFGGSTPSAVHVDRNGTVGWAAVGETAVRELAAALGAEATAPAPTPTPTSEAAPAVVEDELAYERKPIPSGIVINAEGKPRTLAELAMYRPTLVVAITCLCGSVRGAVDQLGAWAERLEVVDVVLFTTFPLDGLPEDWGVRDRAWYDHRSTSRSALGLSGSVSAVLLGADGMVAGGPVPEDEIEQFVADIEAELVEYGVLTRDA